MSTARPSHPRWVELRRWYGIVLFALGIALLPACKDKARPAPEIVAAPVVTDAATDLLFTWVDEKGDFHVEQRVADVPASARETVRVVDPSKEPPSGDQLFVADLRVADAGAYPVRTMRRAEFEGLAVDRRKKSGSVLVAQGPPSALPDTRPAVIIYGASWCGPCHQAAAYFKQRGVAFVEKDIEADGGAAREMQAKLANAGIRGGSIPVIDVRGKLLVGFDQGAVERALAQPL